MLFVSITFLRLAIGELCRLVKFQFVSITRLAKRAGEAAEVQRMTSELLEGETTKPRVFDGHRCTHVIHIFIHIYTC